MKIAYVRAHAGAGTLRKLAALVAEVKPDILALCEIGSGDARAVATRFAMQWAYRGRQAIMWNAVFTATDVQDIYLPALRPFDRRGFVRVDGQVSNCACTLLATQFAPSRDARILQVRFARTQLRKSLRDAIFFSHLAGNGVPLADLDFREVTPEPAQERIYVRGFETIEISARVATV